MALTTIAIGAWNAFFTKAMGFIPKPIGAVIIFVAGWLFSRIVKIGMVKLLKLIKFDTAGEKTGLIEFLYKGNITKTPMEIVGTLIYWFIMILVLIPSLDALGLPIVSDMLNEVFLYIPNVAAAIIVLILVMLFGNLVLSVVRTTASNAGIRAAEGPGRTVLNAIILFPASIAFGLGGIDLATDIM